jgi:hypothetical protein
MRKLLALLAVMAATVAVLVSSTPAHAARPANLPECGQYAYNMDYYLNAARADYAHHDNYGGDTDYNTYLYWLSVWHGSLCGNTPPAATVLRGPQPAFQPQCLSWIQWRQYYQTLAANDLAHGQYAAGQAAQQTADHYNSLINEYC